MMTMMTPAMQIMEKVIKVGMYLLIIYFNASN